MNIKLLIKKLKIENYTINPDGSIDVDGDVNLSMHVDRNIKKIPINFNVVTGDFICNHLPMLKNLEGAPKKVGGSFFCNNCYSLTSLEGCPQKIGGGFTCQKCTSLKTLEGGPKKVGKWFEIVECKSLANLLYAPEKIGGKFTLMWSPLIPRTNAAFIKAKKINYEGIDLYMLKDSHSRIKWIFGPY